MTDEARAATPGWYGKIPYLGDFASRRLPGEFISVWDTWLQEVLQATRADLGDGWLDCYLTMPIWRFVLLPGLVEGSGWAGVLMPSVDKVGRQFPLTVAVPLTSDAALAHAVFDGAEWFATLEDAALGVLDPTRSPEELEQALAPRAFPFSPAPGADSAGTGPRRLPSIGAFEGLVRTAAVRAWASQSLWRALWWTRGRVDGDPLMLTSAGLPTAEEFGWLLRSRAAAEPSLGRD